MVAGAELGGVQFRVRQTVIVRLRRLGGLCGLGLRLLLLGLFRGARLRGRIGGRVALARIRASTAVRTAGILVVVRRVFLALGWIVHVGRLALFLVAVLPLLRIEQADPESEEV